MKILKELKLDNDTMSKVKTLVQWWRQPIGSSEAEIRRTMSQMSEELFDSLLMLKQSIVEQDMSEGRYQPVAEDEGALELPFAWAKQEMQPSVPETLEQLDEIYRMSEEIHRRGDCISLKMLAVTGNDLIQAGMKPGKQLGETLNQLFELVLENPELNQKELLLQKVLSKS